MHKLGTIDISIIIIYAILCLVVAFKYVGKIRNIQEFALGGTFSTRVLAATLFATYTGAGLLLGYIERVYAVGLIFALTAIIEPISWLVTAKFVCNNIEYFKKSGCLSIGDIMQLLYGNIGRWTANILSIAYSVGVIAIQIKATGYLLEYFLYIPERYGAVIGFAIVVTYAYFGGIRAVVFTDALQSLVFLVGIPAACFAAYYALGGYTELINHIPLKHRTVDLTHDNIILLISCVIYSVTPLSSIAYVQRFLIAKSTIQLKQALYYAFFIAIPFYVIIILTGFVTLATIPDHSPQLAFYELITNNLPIGIKGLVIAGILAAIMSTSDSYLNSASVMLSRNIIKPLMPNMSDKTELGLAKFATLLFSFIALFLAFMGQGLAKILWLTENFWTPFIVVPLIAGFLKFRTNSTSFKGSLIIALIFVCSGRIIAGEFGIVSIAFGLFGSAIGLLGTHKLQGKSLGKSTQIKDTKKAPMEFYRS